MPAGRCQHWGRFHGSPAVGQGSLGAPDVRRCCQHYASCRRQLVGCPRPSCLQQTPVTAVPLRPVGFITWVRVPRGIKVLGASRDEILWGCSADGKSTKKLIKCSLQVAWGNGHHCRGHGYTPQLFPCPSKKSGHMLSPAWS